MFIVAQISIEIESERGRRTGFNIHLFFLIFTEYDYFLVLNNLIFTKCGYIFEAAQVIFSKCEYIHLKYSVNVNIFTKYITLN